MRNFLRAWERAMLLSLPVFLLMGLLAGCSRGVAADVSPAPLSGEDRRLLQRLVREARSAVWQAWQEGPPPRWQDYPYTTERQGIIVRFVAGRKPRGCQAFYQGVGDLVLGARLAALDAAFHDARYEPLRKEEAPDLVIEVCIVGPLVPMKGPGDFSLGKELVYMVHPAGSVLMQPSLVREHGWTKKAYLEALCKKEGLPKEAWRDKGVVLYRASIKEWKEPFIQKEGEATRRE